jgi:hypothetical protein
VLLINAMLLEHVILQLVSAQTLPNLMEQFVMMEMPVLERIHVNLLFVQDQFLLSVYQINVIHLEHVILQLVSAQTLLFLIKQLAKMEILAPKMISVLQEPVLVDHLHVAMLQNPICVVFVSKTVERMLRQY